MGAQPHRDARLSLGVPLGAPRPLVGALCPRARALAAMLARLVGAREEQVLLRCDTLELLVELYAGGGAGGDVAREGAR